jgi:2-aminoadipate transaminase
VEEVANATAKVLREQGAQALQYGLTEGYTPLRELLAKRYSREGLNLTSAHILITSGSQQALDLLGKIFIDPGDKILVESPTYMGALQAWNSYEPEYIAIPSDNSGIMTEGLEEALKAKPKFMYVLPNFQNPTGIAFSLPRRQHLMWVAKQHGTVVVEDDPYGELRFEGKNLPSLLEMESLYESEKRTISGDYQGNIIHLGTFSKTLAPGFRLGWVIAAPEVISKLAQAKQGVDLHTSSINQFVAYEMLNSGFLEEHIHVIRRTYRERRDVMLAAMTEHFPAEIKWTRPEGGMFIWVMLPKGMDATELLAKAIERRVAFVPGLSFHATGGGENTMRLNFSNSAPDKIRIGIKLLGEIITEEWNNGAGRTGQTFAGTASRG